MTARGTYRTIGDAPAVRFERWLPHPVERVWRAVTEPEHLRHWFPCEVDVELRAGGAMRFTYAPDSTDEGEVLEALPPTTFAFRWGKDVLRLELAAHDDGTRLTMTHILNEEGAGSAAKVAAGWELCLDALAEHAAGRHDGPAPGGPSPAWLELYEAYIAAGMPSGAEVPGLEEARAQARVAPDR